MASIENQLLQLQREARRQQMEREKIMAETRALTRQTLQEVAELRAQREQQIVETQQQSISPANENSAAPSGGKYFKNGDRVPDNQELMRVWGTAEESEVFAELQDWIDSDREQQEAAKRSLIRPDEQIWFGQGRVPTMEEMADPKKLQMMLKELDAMQ